MFGNNLGAEQVQVQEQVQEEGLLKENDKCEMRNGKFSLCHFSFVIDRKVPSAPAHAPAPAPAPVSRLLVLPLHPRLWPLGHKTVILRLVTLISET
jgi:hypothetical protein